MAAMDEWPTGRIERLGPLVRRLLAPNPSPFTFTGTQTYVIGEGEVAIIDPGPDVAAHVEALLAAIRDERVAAIVCTHTHRDHSPASRAVRAATGAPIVGCAALALDDEGPRADDAFDVDYSPDRVLGDGDRIAGPGWTLEAVATPGHTSNHLCFALPEASALFSGDHVMGWSTTVVAPPDGDMADYMASLERLRTRAERLYYPAHGPAITDPQAHLDRLIAHRRGRERQILDLLREGQQAIPPMVEIIYRDVDSRLHPAAARSVLAHLIDMHSRGLVRRAGEAWQPA
ncbi:MBL fold metallo-hydrolase [Sphingomonas parva]|uniref:MBL fold metallo-hydrolase n=1 Tax=Sphingomonas parva TaxID=2555898 RepID=A0A4Y8ZW69_9SPHN|nr:MBL fold metallo-hydrolase [Sphingomonas parva]TFI58686.1 MBL fold metallo-hydrolase [Sphingomonas parva]